MHLPLYGESFVGARSKVAVMMKASTEVVNEGARKGNEHCLAQGGSTEVF